MESNYYKFQNNSNKYACSYRMTSLETPIIVYNNNQSMIKGGFWDGRLEINNFNLEKTNDITLQVQTIFNPDLSPITSVAYSVKDKFFLCGSKDGNLYMYKLNGYKMEFKKGLYLFDDEITSISINDNLNMFCLSSKGGFINLHILPSCDLVRTIYLNKNPNNNNNNIDENKLFANNIFLSNFPLPCITAYINSKKTFISYTINGKLINEINECDNSYKLKDPIIYTNHSFQDILLYGTNDGFIKIRKFPEMELINSISVFPNKEINAVCVSHDKKYCYVWSVGNVIAVIKA
jgi:WD40 repeat protein